MSKAKRYINLYDVLQNWLETREPDCLFEGGTPEEVRRTVRERKRALGRDGGLILSPTHVLEPEVPVENVAAFFEEAGKRR